MFFSPVLEQVNTFETIEIDFGASVKVLAYGKHL